MEFGLFSSKEFFYASLVFWLWIATCFHKGFISAGWFENKPNWQGVKVLCSVWQSHDKLRILENNVGHIPDFTGLQNGIDSTYEPVIFVYFFSQSVRSRWRNQVTTCAVSVAALLHSVLTWDVTFVKCIYRARVKLMPLSNQLSTSTHLLCSLHNQKRVSDCQGCFKAFSFQQIFKVALLIPWVKTILMSHHSTSIWILCKLLNCRPSSTMSEVCTLLVYRIMFRCCWMMVIELY